MPPRHVYVHVPFCASKCPYCDFNSHAGRDDEQDAYVDALLEETGARAEGLDPETLYVGGGTPTHLDARRLERLLEGVLRRLGRRRLQEASIEANPGSLDRAKVRVLAGLGFDRLSLGVQSFDDRHLATLGRAHDARDAVRSAALAREGGISRLSVDLILAIPGQSVAAQTRDLSRALDLGPEHVSAYVLTYEEGTPFTRWLAEGRLPPPQDERDLAHLHLAVERLADEGLMRYEVSNFAQANAACRHNLAYWRDEEWLGLGAGAHSHERGYRSKNLDDPARYVAAIREGRDATAWIERAPSEIQAFEALMMGLRLEEGVDLARIGKRTGVDLAARHASTFGRYAAAGLLCRENDTIRMTPAGLDVLSGLLRELLPDVEVVTDVLR